MAVAIQHGFVALQFQAEVDEGKKEQDWLQSNAPAFMKNIRNEVAMRL